MTLADKIIILRKQKGWSQEELAEKLDVMRQSVSKWESAQSVPDIAKILQLSELFGVTTDELLKDDFRGKEEKPQESAEQPAAEEKHDESRKISAEEAGEYLAASRGAAGKIAFGTFLCIISPICLLLLLGAHEAQIITAVSEDICALIGLVTLLLIVATAVSVFIYFGSGLTKYDYIEKEAVKLDKEAGEFVKAEKEAASASYTKHNTFGVVLCILGAVSAIVGAFTEHEMLVMVGICGTLLLCACGVYLFVKVGVPWGAMQKMLEEGDYTREAKAAERLKEAIFSVYWLAVTAIYLAYSFITSNWHISWIIWPVAGVLSGLISAIMNIVMKNNK